MTPRALLILACAGWTLLAEKPTLEHVYPTAAARGTTNSLSLSGKFEPWPPKIWSSASSLAFTFPTNKGTVEITVPPDAQPGPCLLRLYNDDGASEPCLFLVSDTPQLRDAEPNNHFSKPQLLTNIPVTINGRLDKNGDVDSFGFSIKAGQWLDARVDSHTLMSKVDAVLRLVSADGYQIEWNHDFDSFDPRLIWRAPEDENVVLQIFGFVYPANAEIQLSGGNGSVYQLHLSISDQPPALPPLKEESNGLLPLEVHGAICPARDEDRYRVTLKKDQMIEASVNALEFGSPLDPWLKFEGPDGKELAKNDDSSGTRDARLESKAPADGEYTFVVGSITRGGAENWRYRLNVKEAFPDYRATIETSAFALPANGTNEVKFTVKRLRNFTNELTASFSNLPEGLSAEPAKISGAEGKLQLIATNAPPFNGPVQLILTDSTTGDRRPVPFELISRSENNGVPGGYSKLLLESTDQLWLTVKPPPPEPPPKKD